MQNTFYDSPHGLMNKQNFSTAADQAILVSECMKLEVFRRVVATKEYTTSAQSGSPVNSAGFTNTYKWENSNKLLGKCPGIIGCKTGITSAAGPCFAGYYERNDIKIAIILCHAKSLEQRWVEIQALVQWVLRIRNIQEQQEEKKKTIAKLKETEL